MPLLPERALVSALKSAPRPISVLVGSPLSMNFTDVERGVPGVDGIVELVRQFLEQHDSALLTDLDTALGASRSADKYQSALSFLAGWVNQEAVNEVVRRAVLQACRNPTRFDSADSVIDDASPEDWWLPAAAEQLGKLLVDFPQVFAGPILTTNFDPLVAVGVRNAGGAPVRTIIDSDGNLPSDAEESPGTHRIVHLHGYWRGSDTLHTAEQLVSERERLSASLKRVLENRLLLVVGYSGWDDAFTRALADILNDDQSQVDVIWCFREDDQDVVNARYKDLLARVRGAITRGRFRKYGGIDCHRVFGTIREYLDGVVTVAAPACPLLDWKEIAPSFLDELQELDDAELQLYFDGQVPSWRHAVSNRVPKRVAVETLIGALAQEAQESRNSLHLLLGAGGEGKSTTLLQVASHIAMSEEWCVLWRPGPKASLDTGQVLQLPRGTQNWLLVTDDGDELITALVEILRGAHSEGRSDIHILVAARDTDWIDSGGMAQPWSSFAPGYSAPFVLRGLDAIDAERIVGAWSNLGGNGLGRLGDLSSTPERVESVLNAVSDEATRGEGSFFGGLLNARLGPEQLREHLVALLSRLSEITISGSSASLADALMFVACCHSALVRKQSDGKNVFLGLEEMVLAYLLGVDKNRVHRDVVRPLGDEAAAARSAKSVFTRHKSVSDALLVIGQERLGFDLPELWSDLVRRVIEVVSFPRFVGHRC